MKRSIGARTRSPTAIVVSTVRSHSDFGIRRPPCWLADRRPRPQPIRRVANGGVLAEALPGTAKREPRIRGSRACRCRECLRRPRAVPRARATRRASSARAARAGRRARRRSRAVCRSRSASAAPRGRCRSAASGRCARFRAADSIARWTIRSRSLSQAVSSGASASEGSRSPRAVSPSSPICWSRLTSAARWWRTSSTCSIGSPVSSASSSIVGSRPSRTDSSRSTRPTLRERWATCTGRRIVRPEFSRPRWIAWRIHRVA